MKTLLFVLLLIATPVWAGTQEIEIDKKEIFTQILDDLVVEIGLPLEELTGGALAGNVSRRVGPWYFNSNLERWDRAGNAARSGTAEIGKYFAPPFYGALWVDLRENEPRGLLWASQTIALLGIDLGGNYIEIGAGNNRISSVTKESIKVLEREPVWYAGVNTNWRSFGLTAEITAPFDGNLLGIIKGSYTYPFSDRISTKITETIDFVGGKSDKSIGMSLILRQ